MLDLHAPTSEFIIGFYNRASRYYQVTTSLFSQGYLDYEDALVKVRLEIYGLHNQILKLVKSLTRRLDRFNSQIDSSLQVCYKKGFVPNLYCVILT